MNRSLNQNVRLTVETVPTEHPAGTEGDHWFWQVETADGITMQQQTGVPMLEVSLPPGSYTVTARLETLANDPLGATASVEVEIVGQSVTIQTAGTITVEML